MGVILNELPLFLYLLSFKDAKNRKIIWSELTFFVILQANKDSSSHCEEIIFQSLIVIV